MREEAPHGSDSLCKQNLKQNRPPVNSRQPRIDTFPTQSRLQLLQCMWKTTLLCLRNEGKKKRTYARSSAMLSPWHEGSVCRCVPEEPAQSSLGACVVPKQRTCVCVCVYIGTRLCVFCPPLCLKWSWSGAPPPPIPMRSLSIFWPVEFPSFPARQHPEESFNGALLTPAQSSFTCCSHKEPFTLNIHYRAAQ